MKQHKWHKEMLAIAQKGQKVIFKPRCNGKPRHWKFLKECLEKLNDKT